MRARVETRRVPDESYEPRGSLVSIDFLLLPPIAAEVMPRPTGWSLLGAHLFGVSGARRSGQRGGTGSAVAGRAACCRVRS